MSSAVERAAPVVDWGIEPVPPSHRTLSVTDVAVLWGDLGIGLLVLVTGALLVPGLGFEAAFVAIVAGSLIGSALLAIPAAVGARLGVPTMTLLRPILGVRGSWLPSALNALQLLGWTAVELWAMSFVADLVSRRAFGFSARWLWLVLAAVVCTSLALWGPVGVVRAWMERFGAWVIGALSVAVTALLLAQGALGDALDAPSTGAIGFGPALDLVIAMPVSWLPLVADYTRFARSPRAAWLGTFGGYLLANVWLYTLGAMLVLGEGADPSPEGIAAGILALSGGSVAGVMFLVGLLAGETDEAFADMYSGAVSMRNIVPGASQAVLTIALAAVATVLAGWLTMARYETFLFLIGSVFVPLFGVLTAHYVRRSPLREGRRAATPAFSLCAWIAGLAVYHWILPTGPAWWTERVGAWLGTPVAARVPWISASIPSFLVAFALALLLTSRSAPRNPGSGEAAVYHPG